MYYFEYDKENYLINYKEKYKRVKSKKIDSICEIYIHNNQIIKFEENRKFKNLIKYIEPIKIVHRFEAGESWLNIQKKGFFDFSQNNNSTKKPKEDENVQRNYPDFYFHDKNKKENDLISNYNAYEYPTVVQQINLENDIIYNLRFKLKKSLINNWCNLITF
jgi:hypothetical protein